MNALPLPSVFQSFFTVGFIMWNSDSNAETCSSCRSSSVLHSFTSQAGPASRSSALASGVMETLLIQVAVLGTPTQGININQHRSLGEAHMSTQQRSVVLLPSINDLSSGSSSFPSPTSKTESEAVNPVSASARMAWINCLQTFCIDPSSLATQPLTCRRPACCL